MPFYQLARSNMRFANSNARGIVQLFLAAYFRRQFATFPDTFKESQ